MCDFYVRSFLFFFIVVGFIALALLHLIVVSIKPAACCLLLPFLQKVIEFTIITIFRCLTRLSSLLATMDANRLSPASSEGEFHKLLTSKTQLRDVFKGAEKNVSQNSRGRVRYRELYISDTKMHPFYYWAMIFIAG